MAKKKAKRRDSRRYANGSLRREIRQAIVLRVVEQMKNLVPREEIERQIQVEYSVQPSTASELYNEGLSSFEGATGITPAQINFAIAKRNLDILRDDEASPTAVHRASTMLQKSIGADDDDADLPDKTRLWMDYLDQMPVEQIDQFIDDHRKGLFDIRAISEQTVDVMVETARKRSAAK